MKGNTSSRPQSSVAHAVPIFISIFPLLSFQFACSLPPSLFSSSLLVPVTDLVLPAHNSHSKL